MNVASLELCKELCEISSWRPTVSESEMNWRVTADGNQQLWARLNPQDWDEVIDSYPAYDLGYLRKKILDELERLHPESVTLESWGYYGDLSHALLDGEDETARFAIELFKQGILTK